MALKHCLNCQRRVKPGKEGTQCMKVRHVVLALLIALGLSLLTPMASPEPSQAASPPVPLENFAPTSLPPRGHPKVESRLWQLLDAAQNTGAETFTTRNGIDFAEGKVRVIVEAKLGCVEDTIDAVILRHGTVEATYDNLVQAVVLASTIPLLADDSAIRNVRLPLEPVPAVVSEASGLIGAEGWHSAGLTGEGVKVGILDGGFSGYGAMLGTELPAYVHTHWSVSIAGPGSSQHGTACAEIVHDVAPEADLYLANYATLVEKANAVYWLIDQGVDIISCSMGSPLGGPGDGTGPVCGIVDEARAAGVLWCNSAGNYATDHWMGTWQDADSDGWHDLPLPVQAAKTGDLITVLLKWNDGFGTSSNNYDLYVTNYRGFTVGMSLNVQDGDDEPTETVSFSASYSGPYYPYYVWIHRESADGAGQFHLFVPNCETLQYSVASTSLTPPADSASALAVGAVPWHSPNTLESFSSQGPTIDGRTKPDVVAPDRVSTSTYGAGAFPGTSASAPHVAGAAALVKQVFPEYGPARIQAFLEERAVDLGVVGKDNQYGSGRLFLGAAPLIRYSIVLDAQPRIASLTVDATTYSKEQLPVELSWLEGSEHVCAALPTVSSTQEGTRHAFASWSDGATSASRTITATHDATYTANYKTQHYLTVSSEQGNPSGAGWYDNGSTAPIEADAIVGAGETRYAFLNWTLDSAEHTGNPASVSMDAPHTAVANYKTQHRLTVESDYAEPSGDGWYDEGSTADIDTEEIVGDDETRHVFLNWVVDGAEDEYDTSASVTMNSPHSAFADYNTQHYLTVISDYGNPTGEDWYDEGATAEIDTEDMITEGDTRYVFETWLVDAQQKSSNPSFLEMDAPHQANADYQTQYYLTVESEYGEPTGEGWYDDDSTATASVTSPVGAIIRKVFTKWSGDSTSSNVSVDLVMNDPKTLVANWRSDYLYVYAIAGGALIVLVVGSAAAISSRKLNRRRRPVRKATVKRPRPAHAQTVPKE